MSRRSSLLSVVSWSRVRTRRRHCAMASRALVNVATPRHLRTGNGCSGVRRAYDISVVWLTTRVEPAFLDVVSISGWRNGSGFIALSTARRGWDLSDRLASRRTRSGDLWCHSGDCLVSTMRPKTRSAMRAPARPAAVNSRCYCAVNHPKVLRTVLSLGPKSRRDPINLGVKLTFSSCINLPEGHC